MEAKQRRQRRLRPDVLPESYQYRDDGCEVSPSCLQCPRAVCKYDDPDWRRRGVRDRRDEEMLEVRRRERLTASALAERFGVSERTVWRALRREREGAGVGRGAA